MIPPLILAILPLPDGGFLTHRSPVYQLREFVSVQRDVSFLFSFPAAYEVQTSPNLRDWTPVAVCSSTYHVVLDCAVAGNRFWRIVPTLNLK